MPCLACQLAGPPPAKNVTQTLDGEQSSVICHSSTRFTRALTLHKREHSILRMYLDGHRNSTAIADHPWTLTWTLPLSVSTYVHTHRRHEQRQALEHFPICRSLASLTSAEKATAVSSLSMNERPIC